MKIKWEKTKNHTSLDIGNRFCIDFNWRTGWALGVEVNNDGFGASVELLLIKPTITFIYWLPRARGL